MRPYLIVSGLTLMYLGSALAQSAQPIPPARTAQTLAEACASDDKTFVMRCTAYLGGVADSMDFLSAYQNQHGAALTKAKLTLKPFTFCHDQPWSAEMLRQSFLKWMDSDPKRAQEDQYVATVNAIHDSFPCK